MPTAYIYLILAIITETIGTSALQASQQFTRLWPSLIVLTGYALSFYFMSQTLKFMPVGIVYAVWSGIGIVLIALIGLFYFGQKLDLAAVLGMALIIAGVATIHLFSSTASH